MSLSPFHLAIQVHDLAKARAFYGEVLGFAEGRSSDTWIDFNMFGHQLVVHLNRQMKIDVMTNKVDGDAVPVPHFGVVLSLPHWLQLKDRLIDVIDDFIIEPHIRFAGQVGEQATMFFLDPSGNALEFKGFKDIESQLFEK